MLNTVASGILAAGVAAAALLAPSPAKAWWVRGPVYGPPVVVVPPYAPPPLIVAAPRPIWVPPHYNRWGYVVPGHWR